MAQFDAERAKTDLVYFIKNMGNIELKPYQENLIKHWKEKSQRFMAHCRDCKHQWKVCNFPISLDNFIKLCDAQTKCEKCHGVRIGIGGVDDA